VEVCRGAAQVLELGSGAGRMLRALAQPRRTLCGLELDAGLLRLGREAVAGLPARKRAGVELVRGDMRSFALGQRFERVLLPYNGLYCLLTSRDVERCLRAVHAALVPGGSFAFDVWNADGVAAQGLAPASEDEEVARFEHASRLWRVFESCRSGRGAQRLDVTYTYVPDGRAKARSQLLQQRYLRSVELFGLLETCGFRVTSKLGSFDGARFSARAQRLVVTAQALGL
jgi:SAM-dependent methyltransferase